ncbi:DUF4190 domain-containing protein [Streptosporangium sp. NPDC051022]|uniref:DUF4190 domain-containing protein n=1 Tax=Streptosporangium sp. NPDC051022 TaxID=3155752 RepID=UPI00342D6FAD
MYDQNPPGFHQPSYGYGYAGPPTLTPPPPRNTSGLAVASLLLGIFWLCGLGSLLAVILGHIALSNIRTGREKGHGMAVTGVVFGYVGLVATLFFFVVSVMSSGSPEERTAVVATETAGAREEVAGPQGKDAEEATPVPSPTRSAFAWKSYKQLSGRGFDKLVKDPDAYTGERFILYGEVFQFDAATGNDAFLANIGPTKLQPSSGYVSFDQNAAFTGPKSRLSDVVKGDLFQVYVTVLGSFSYDTQMGGNTTVPSFRIDRIKVYGSTK